MTAAADSFRRLQQLLQILAESKAALNSTTGRDTDLADFPLGSLPVERISRLTSELTQEPAADLDDVDRLAMQILLNEYVAAVAHLRVAARLADRRVAGAAVPIQETRVRIRRREKRTKAVERKKT